MTKPLANKHQRLLAIERELRQLREVIPDAIALKVANALLVATNSRLIGEVEAYRRNVQVLERQVEMLKGRRVAA